jgi:hypothetical protein
MTTISVKARVIFTALAMLAAVSSASADLSGISDVIFRIEATNATGTGFIEVTKDQLVYHPTTDSYHWNLPVSLVIQDDLFQTIATLQNANLAILKNATKKIAGAFAVQAGDSETTFEIQLPQLSFGTLPEPLTMGRMGLACNVTDVGGGGVAMHALSAGAGMLRGDYNGLVPGGTMFAQVLYQVTATSGSGSGYQNYPAAGYADIASAVSDMSSRLDFTLTAGDLGGGTHYYEIVPEPAGLGLLLIGVGALAVRRR